MTMPPSLMKELEAALGARMHYHRSRQVRRGMKFAAMQGRHISRVPLGYRRVLENGTLRLEPDPVTAPLVRELFRRAARRGASLRTLAVEMAEQGLTTASGGALAPSTLRRMLTNCLYAGRVRLSGAEFPGIHPPLVTAAQFRAAERALHRLQKRSR